MRKVSIIVTLFIFSICFSVNNTQAETNIIKNGDFTESLDYWIFEDMSSIGNCIVSPYTEAYIDNGQAVIHGHSCYSDGMLYQVFDPVKNPSFFHFDYKDDGKCSRVSGFLKNGDSKIVELTVHRDSALTWLSYTTIRILDKEWVVHYPIDPGNFEVNFDYDSMKAIAYLNGEQKLEADLASDIIVDRVELSAHHSCYDGRNDVYGYFDNVVLLAEPPFITVQIDIKPDSDENTINLDSAGVVPVAILSSNNFDATSIIPESVSLAGARVKMVGKSSKYLCNDEDVNGDGLIDIICMVYTAQFMIEPGESTAVLEAETNDGKLVKGEDFVRIVP